MAPRKKKPRYKKSRAEVVDGFYNQIRALDASFTNFDAGNRWEAFRIATSLYTLLYKAKKGPIVGILYQLNIRTRITYIDSRDECYRVLPETKPNVINLGPGQPPFCCVKIPAGTVNTMVWDAVCNGDLKKEEVPATFQEWWDGNLFPMQDGRVFTRGNLIHEMRSRDGGAHFDDSYEDINYRILSTTGWGNSYLADKDGNKLENPNFHFLVMRHMGWEIYESISRYLDGRLLQ